MPIKNNEIIYYFSFHTIFKYFAFIIEERERKSEH